MKKLKHIFFAGLFLLTVSRAFAVTNIEDIASTIFIYETEDSDRFMD